MNLSKIFAYYYLCKCCNFQEGARISLKDLYTRFFEIMKVLYSVYKIEKVEILGRNHFNKIIKVLLKDFEVTSDKSICPQIIKTSKGLMIANLMINENFLITKSNDQSPIFETVIQKLGIDTNKELLNLIKNIEKKITLNVYF